MNIYNFEEVEDALEEESLNSFEEGFMRGYLAEV